MIRASDHCCYVTALNTPRGSSPFADASNLHTDGPDAIPAMYSLLAWGYLLPDQAHKHLGVRMTMTGNFEVEKEF